jgi:hypothetical protein
VVGAWLIRSERWRYYTDGISIRQPSENAPLRHVLWEDPQPLGGRLNNNADNHAPTVSADGRTMVFVRGSAGKNADLYSSHWNGEAWDDLHPVATLNTPFDELSPALSRNGQYLYFSSNRPGGLGGYDLWVARLQDGDWVEPVNLGPQINTEFDETGPVPTPDGERLYFSSNRSKKERTEMDKVLGKKSAAGNDYDIFVAELKPGADARRVDELNSASDDLHVALTPRGDFVYFSSNRPGGHGGMDIYRSRILDGKLQRPQNLDAPVNSSADETDPAVWMEGYDLVFSSNRNSPNPQEFYLYHSVSREVFVRSDYSALLAFLGLFKKLKWLILLFTFALVALLYLLRNFMNEQWRVRASLLQKCLLGSALLHVVIAFLLSLWIISSAIYQTAQQPFTDLTLDESVLAKERLALDVREQITEMQRQPVPLPPQEKIEHLPVTEIEPQKQEVKPESAPTKVETVAIAVPTPAAEKQQVEKLQPAEHAREIPATRLAASPVQLESPQPIAPQATKELAPASSTVDVRPVKTAARPQVPDVAAVNVQADMAQQQPSPQRSALDRELPVSESTPATTPTATSQAPAKVPDSLKLPTQLAMEAGKPSQPQGAGPQIKPLAANESLATAADTSLPQRQPQAAPQQVPGGSTAKEQTQGSALNGDLPVTESQATARLASAQQAAGKSVDAPAINTKLTMETEKPAQSQGTGPEVKPLQTGSSLASATDTPVPTQQAQRTTPDIGAGGTGKGQPQRSALDRELPVAESQTLARLTPAKTGPAGAMDSLQLPTKVALETAKATASTAGSGPEIKPLGTGSSLATAPAGESSMPQMGPQKLAQNLAAGTAGNPAAQRSALDNHSPVQESEAGTRLTAENKSLTNTVGSLSFQTRVDMEAERPANVQSGGQELKSLQAEFLVASAASQFPVPRGEPQKTEQQIGAGGGTPKVFQPQSGPVRPMESTPNLVEIRGPGQSPRLKIPALEMAAALTFSGPSEAPPAYLLRDPKQRSRVLESLGGTAQTETAIARSLEWFTRHQEPDGHWAILKYGGLQGHDVSATALALLCYMGWGAKHTEPGPHQAAIARGLDWMTQQVKFKGDLRGDGGTMYDHGMGTIALAEAYGLTKDANLVEPLRKAIGFILYAQNPETGGWRYIPGADGDTSVFGWQLMALKSASLAGLETPPDVLVKARGWLERVASGESGGLYGYQDKIPLPAMCAEGMFCQQLLGRPPTDPRMRETAAYLKTMLPSKEKEKINFYYWYYGSLALYQHQGPIWEEWNEQLRNILVNSQNLQGDDSGSWDPTGQWSRESGRAVATALATLSLEVYYRYLPLYGLTSASR